MYPQACSQENNAYNSKQEVKKFHIRKVLKYPDSGFEVLFDRQVR